MTTGRTRDQKGRTTTCKCSLITDAKRQSRLTESIADTQRMETRAENLTKQERNVQREINRQEGR